MLLPAARVWNILRHDGPKGLFGSAAPLGCQGERCLLPSTDSGSALHTHVDAQPLWEEGPLHTHSNC